MVCDSSLHSTLHSQKKLFLQIFHINMLPRIVFVMASSIPNSGEVKNIDEDRLCLSGTVCGTSPNVSKHRLTKEVDLQSLFGLNYYVCCTHCLSPRTPHYLMTLSVNNFYSFFCFSV